MATPLDQNPQDNPLLTPSNLPHGAPKLEGLKPEYFLPAIKAGIAEAKKNIDAIKKNPAAPTFENTIEALEFCDLSLSRANSIFGSISSANSSDEIRKIEDKVDAALVKHENNVSMDAELFSRIKAVYDSRATLKLTSEQNMLLEKVYKNFIRGGALLDDAGKKELRQINERLTKLQTTYKNNIVKSTDAYKKVIDNEDDLRGVPERAKNIYKQFAEEAGMPGKWLIKLSPPSDIFEYCENRALREEIYRADYSLAWQDKYDNSDIVIEIVKLRKREAELLGYANYAEFVLDNRMAKTPQAVMELLDKNTRTYKPAAEAFVKKVADFARQTDGLTDLKPWDMALYSRKLKEKTFHLDLEEVRPYFDLEKVLDGMRTHAEKLFNIHMTETTGKYPVYHPDVKVYEVTDNKTGEMIGLLYADYYARPGAKNAGAWMQTFRDRGLENGVNRFALVQNVCNFDKPTKTQPTLLSLRDVETTFHEFGHGLHALLAQGNYPSLTGANVKWDFVEAPSQLQENWTKEKEVLDTFAVHYKTGQKIPADLVKKINDMGNFDAAYQGLRQTFYGQLDMKWYTTDPATIKSVTDLEDDVTAKTWVFPRMAGPMSTTLSHIFSGGYAAGYYSYKWAEILEADIFEEFKKKGLYDPATAGRLRDALAKGGTVDPMDIFIAMMGRKPDPDALFRREGLLPEKKQQKPSAAPKHGKP